MSEPGPKVAFVTGGGSGIGAATALRLREQGWEVVISGRRREALDEIAESCGALPVVADVADEPSVVAALGAAVTRFGGLDAMVCAAGTGAGGSVVEQTLDSFQRVWAVNVAGAFLCMRSALPELVRRRGSIVTVGSLAGLAAPPSSAAYASSKAGLAMLTRCVAVDFGRDGVRANCVCPGWIRTPLADVAMDELAGLSGGSREDAYRQVGGAAPLGRAGDPHEVASLIAWLLGPYASYLNGAVIPVDGGTSATDPGAVAFAPTPR